MRLAVDLSKRLYVVEGSKGFRKAIKHIAGQDALIQRCTWHKLENIKIYLENLNSQLTKYTRKVKNWSSSDQRYRWIASGLLEAEKI